MPMNTLNFEISRSVDHGVCVDLAHEPAPVHGLDPLNVKEPLVGRGPGQGNPRVPRYHRIVDAQDRLRVDTHPRNLKKRVVIYCFKCFRLPWHLLAFFQFSCSLITGLMDCKIKPYPERILPVNVLLYTIPLSQAIVYKRWND